MGPQHLAFLARRKLTVDDVKFIRDAHRLDRKARKDKGLIRGVRGLRQRLAKRFHVSPDTIKDVIRRRRYRNIK